MVHAIIVDDEAPSREELRYLLQDFKDIKVIAEADNGFKAIQLNKKLKPDVMFLDIQMSEITGIEAAEEIVKNDHIPMIIFVTAFDNFAYKAFLVNALDYLLKPICLERLQQAVKKVMERLKTGKDTYIEELRDIIRELKKDKKPEESRITVYKDGRLVPLKSYEIIYITIEDRHTIIISTKGRFEIQQPLNYIERCFVSPNFFKCHRGFLINIDYIEEIDLWFNSTYQLKMKDINERIPVSRGQSKKFRRLMNIE